ncbi:hypothetical protein KAH27_00980 [bacterium]|nr:hypothetical protein [bacterium]
MKNLKFNCIVSFIVNKAIIFRRQITPYLRYMTLVAALILTVTFLISCAVIQQPRAYETQDQLAVCGFKQKLADTPVKLDKLKELPQRKLILREHKGTNYYLYANAHQKCLFIGTEKAYQSYQKSEIQKQIVDNNRTANSKNEAAAAAGRVEAFNWSVGDMWVPWMYY